MKNGGDDAFGQLIRLAALAAQSIRLIQNLDDALLFLEGREGDLEGSQLIQNNALNSCALL